MFKHLFPLTLLAACVSTAACDRSIDSNITGPSSEAVGGATLSTEPTMNLSSSSLTAQLSGRGPCPSFHPFKVSTSLVVRADGGFRLTEIGMSFVDRTGTRGPQVTLPAPVPTRQFGSELTDARTAWTFPLDFAYGCGTDRHGTIVIFATGRDDRGYRKSTELRATVR